jgi:hypothetical protein
VVRSDPYGGHPIKIAASVTLVFVPYDVFFSHDGCYFLRNSRHNITKFQVLDYSVACVMLVSYLNVEYLCLRYFPLNEMRSLLHACFYENGNKII